jgi:hypothetical protein
MRRTFGFEVLACPRCGGRLRLIALIEEAAVIVRILRHRGLPTDLPAARPARGPPLVDGLLSEHDTYSDVVLPESAVLPTVGNNAISVNTWRQRTRL